LPGLTFVVTTNWVNYQLPVQSPPITIQSFIIINYQYLNHSPLINNQLINNHHPSNNWVSLPVTNFFRCLHRRLSLGSFGPSTSGYFVVYHAVFVWVIVATTWPGLSLPFTNRFIVRAVCLGHGYRFANNNFRCLPIAGSVFFQQSTGSSLSPSLSSINNQFRHFVNYRHRLHHHCH